MSLFGFKKRNGLVGQSLDSSYRFENPNSKISKLELISMTVVISGVIGYGVINSRTYPTLIYEKDNMHIYSGETKSIFGYNTKSPKVCSFDTYSRRISDGETLGGISIRHAKGGLKKSEAQKVIKYLNPQIKGTIIIAGKNITLPSNIVCGLPFDMDYRLMMEEENAKLAKSNNKKKKYDENVIQLPPRRTD